MRVLVADLRKHVGQAVTVCGWVNAIRLQRTMQFVLVRDPTGMVQLTHKRGGEGDVLESVIEDLTPQSAVRVVGRVLDNPIVNLDGLEIIPESVEILNRSESPLPIDEHSGPDHQLDWRFLDVRMRPQARLVFDVQTTVESSRSAGIPSRAVIHLQACHRVHRRGRGDGVNRRRRRRHDF